MLVGPNAQLFPKMNFDGPPNIHCFTVAHYTEQGGQRWAKLICGSCLSGGSQIYVSSNALPIIIHILFFWLYFSFSHFPPSFQVITCWQKYQLLAHRLIVSQIFRMANSYPPTWANQCQLTLLAPPGAIYATVRH